MIDPSFLGRVEEVVQLALDAGLYVIINVHHDGAGGLYAGAATTHVWGNAAQAHDDWGQEGHVVSQLDRLKSKFVDAGLPMILGE